MTAIEEILDKHVGTGILIPYPNIVDAMEEYANYVLSVAAEKAEIIENYYTDIISVDKSSILNCLKD